MSYKIEPFGVDLERFFVIAGPCVIESREHALFIAQTLKTHCAALGVQFVFKASYDKANRTSLTSYRGPGLDGLEVLREVRETVGVPVLTDVHESHDVVAAAKVVDVIQIPAFLCRQTDLLLAAAATGKIVNVKKGQFLAPHDAKAVVDKFTRAGYRKPLLTERGASYGYNNLVVDFRSFQIMKSFGVPVVFDVTHSLQSPGGLGSVSGGQPEFIPMFARAGAAAGVDGFFFEVHENPAKALSDGPNALQLDLFPEVIAEISAVRQACLR